MPEYDAKEWQARTGEVRFSLTPRHMVDVWISCTKVVSVFGVQGEASTLLKSGSEFRFRGQVKGFEELLIVGAPSTPFGLKVRERPLQNGEDISDEKPPVISLPEPSNLVAKMRRMAAEHHRQFRMPVLDPEDGPSFNRYEIDDDDQDVLFEEEAFERHQKLKAEKAAKAKADKEAKARKDAEADPNPQAKNPSPAPGPAPEPREGRMPDNPAPAADAAE